MYCRDCDGIAIQLTLVTLNLSSSYIPQFRKMLSPLLKRLRTVIAGNGKSECFIGSIPDPFVQVHMLQLLCLLATDDDAATDQVMDVVDQVGTESPQSRADDLESGQHVQRWQRHSVRMRAHDSDAQRDCRAPHRGGEHSGKVPPKHEQRHALRLALPPPPGTRSIGRFTHRWWRSTTPSWRATASRF